MSHKRRSIVLASLVLAFVTNLADAGDVLVVCPQQFRNDLDRWVQHRQSGGLSITVIDSQRSANSLRQAIREAADDSTKYVMLVGDAPVIGRPCNATRQVPILYAPSTVTAAWGSTPTLATDLLYGDFDQDNRPDAVVGRLPVDARDQLVRLITRIIAHEQSQDFGAWRGCVQLTGGVGGFGILADTAIESVTRSVVTNLLPQDTRTSVAYASPGHRFFPKEGSFTNAILNRYQQGSRFWIYAGHGHVTALDRVPQNVTGKPVLDQRSVQQLRRPVGSSPIAVMLACYTGALDASEDCLAEEMLLCEGGPVAVFAGSRITMPYGNCATALGLINGVYGQKLPRLGDAWMSALLEMHAETPPDAVSSRTMIDGLAALISPAGSDLSEERHEHMRLYNLLGDPTLKLRHPYPVTLEVAPGHRAGQPIDVKIMSPIDGRLTLSLDRPLGAETGGDPNRTTIASRAVDVLAGREHGEQIELPQEVKGPIVVRVFVAGRQAWATAAARTIVHPPLRR